MTRTALHPSRRAALGLIGAALLWPRPGGAEVANAIRGRAFGTDWSITGQPRDRLEMLRPGIETLFDQIDRQMSPWRPDSTLSRFNGAASGVHPAEDEVIRVTRRAIALAGESDGAFDPTVGPLVARWGFGPITGSDRPDWRGLSIAPRGIAKARGDLTLDLCGIAKGRALDRAVELAGSAGLTDLLFDLGGELMALGRHPSGRDWRIAVQHPMPGRAPPAALRLPPGWAAATSGLRSQSYVLGGRRYGHIIDPAARAPADGRLQSVTVMARDAMSADGWATALFAAGIRSGPALARDRGIAALFLVQDSDTTRQVRTGGIGKMSL